MPTTNRRSFLAWAAAGLAAGCSRLGAWKRQPIHILQITDMHILDEASMAYSQSVVQAMNVETGDFALVTGDLATSGLRDELVRAKRVLDGLDMPYYVVPGNHDAQHAGDRDEPVFREVFGLESTNYHFAVQGLRCIALDPGCGTDYLNNAVRPDALAWLGAELAAMPREEPILLFTHYPYGPGVPYETTNAAEVLALFADRNLLGVVSGHFHGNTERTPDGILMTTTACSSSTRTNHDGTEAKGFRVFHIGEDLSVRTEFRTVPA